MDEARLAEKLKGVLHTLKSQEPLVYYGVASA